jgi:hypothetical protein
MLVNGYFKLDHSAGGCRASGSVCVGEPGGGEEKRIK